MAHRAGNLLNRKQLDDAEGYRRCALAVNPSIPAAHYSLGATLFRLGRLEEAMQHYPVRNDKIRSKATTILSVRIQTGV